MNIVRKNENRELSEAYRLHQIITWRTPVGQTKDRLQRVLAAPSSLSLPPMSPHSKVVHFDTESISAGTIQERTTGISCLIRVHSYW